MKIVIPTDFSKCARNAADFGVEYAIKTQAEIVLLHTFVLRYSDSSYFVDFDLSLKEVAEKQLEMELDRLLEQYPSLQNLTIHQKCEIGGLVENIEFLAKEESFDLIVMGTKGVSSWDEVLIGSNTAAVISNCAIPVLVVPNKTKYKAFNELAYAVALEERLANKDVQLIGSLSSADFNLKLFHSYEDVLDIDDRKEAELIGHFKGHFPKANITLESDFEKSKIESIEDYLDNLKPELVIAKTEQKGFLQRIFSVSVTSSLAEKADYPLLILKKP